MAANLTYSPDIPYDKETAPVKAYNAKSFHIPQLLVIS